MKLYKVIIKLYKIILVLKLINQSQSEKRNQIYIQNIKKWKKKKKKVIKNWRY